MYNQKFPYIYLCNIEELETTVYTSPGCKHAQTGLAPPHLPDGPKKPWPPSSTPQEQLSTV